MWKPGKSSQGNGFICVAALFGFNCRAWVKLREMRYVTAAAIVLVLLSSCAQRRPLTAPSSVTVSREWVDLQGGWRVRVITPILRSGGFLMRPPTPDASTSSPGNPAIVLRTDSDFLGYELAFYEVRDRGNGRVSVALGPVEERIDGKTSATEQPRRALFNYGRRPLHIRLLHLTRSATIDHDMAILASAKLESLDALTQAVQQQAASCRNEGTTRCEFIPGGIAITPEKPASGKPGIWAPAR